MTSDLHYRRTSRLLRTLCIPTAVAFFAGAVFCSPTAYARIQPSETNSEEALSPVFVEVDTVPLTESEQPADVAEADALALRVRIPELLEQRGVELAEKAGADAGYLRVSVGWKYYEESIYQVHVVYTSPSGVEHTSDWTIEGIDSGDVIDEFDVRLDKYAKWFSLLPADTSSPSSTEATRKPNKAWLSVGITGAALAVVGGGLAVTGGVLDPRETSELPAITDGGLGRTGSEDNSARRALVYSGAAVAGVGIALAAVGFSLHFSKKPRKSAPRASIGPLLGGNMAGLSATGRF